LVQGVQEIGFKFMRHVRIGRWMWFVFWLY